MLTKQLDGLELTGLISSGVIYSDLGIFVKNMWLKQDVGVLKILHMKDAIPKRLVEAGYDGAQLSSVAEYVRAGKQFGLTVPFDDTDFEAQDLLISSGVTATAAEINSVQAQLSVITGLDSSQTADLLALLAADGVINGRLTALEADRVLTSVYDVFTASTAASLATATADIASNASDVDALEVALPLVSARVGVIEADFQTQTGADAKFETITNCDSIRTDVTAIEAADYRDARYFQKSETYTQAAANLTFAPDMKLDRLFKHLYAFCTSAPLAFL